MTPLRFLILLAATMLLISVDAAVACTNPRTVLEHECFEYYSDGSCRKARRVTRIECDDYRVHSSGDTPHAGVMQDKEELAGRRVFPGEDGIPPSAYG